MSAGVGNVEETSVEHVRKVTETPHNQDHDSGRVSSNHRACVCYGL